MLRRARESISSAGISCGAGSDGDAIKYTLLESNALPDTLDDSFDFLYSFDCFPHCDMHTIFAYLKEMRRVLKPGAHAMLHTSNLLAPAGFARFAQQKGASVQVIYPLNTHFWRPCESYCWVSRHASETHQLLTCTNAFSAHLYTILALKCDADVACRRAGLLLRDSRRCSQTCL